MKIIYYTVWFLTRLITSIFFRIKVKGRQHLPRRGGFILGTNHISYYDPLLAGSWTRRQVYFLAKKELFENKFLGWIMNRTNALPVKRGSIDRGALELAVETINKGYGLTIFPEGTRSKTDRFLEPKPGIGMIAIRAKCPIVPAYIHGSNRLKDCFLGKQRLSITYGEPLSFSWVTSFAEEKESYFKISQMVMEKIGQIKERVISLK